VCLVSQSAYAAELQSSSYKFTESTIGSGGSLRSSSANYQAKDAIGAVAIGNAASTNYQVKAGSVTTSDPTLSFSISSSSVIFPDFSATVPSVATSAFTVSDYTSYGYVVQIIGTAPTSGAHTITPLAITSTSSAGIEQFGINLVANTAPSSVGANPNNGSFGYGTAATNYATPNSYRYVQGETIAQSAKSSGLTTYTISYLVNVAGLTPGGQYTMNQTIIVTGTY
jgi:hypothetical protein